MKRNLFGELSEGFQSLRDERNNKIILNKTHREMNENTEIQKTVQQDQSKQNEINEE